MATKLTAKLVTSVIRDRHNCDIYKLSEALEFKGFKSKFILVMKTPTKIKYPILDMYLVDKNGDILYDRPFAGFGGTPVNEALDMYGYTLI